MTSHFKDALKFLRLLPRAMALMLVVSAPLLAVTSLRAADHTIIEAPTMKNSGAGLVLMVSLQRG